MARAVATPHRLAGLLVAFAALAACGGTAAADPAPAHVPAPTVDAKLATAPGRETVVFAGGCFWGIQAVFEHVKGVISATAGYSGGTLKSPSYEEVSTGRTGHAESVQVVFDPSVVTFGTLLKVFLTVAHDPTELNRQGPDDGTQYRSAIFYTTDEQKTIAKSYIDELTKAKVYPKPIVTEVTPFKAFYKAEEYHQDFYLKNPTYPYIVINDLPKVGRLKQQMPDVYAEKPAHP
jgi:peptide-methionine (S)-S-oxide reductase